MHFSEHRNTHVHVFTVSRSKYSCIATSNKLRKYVDLYIQCILLYTLTQL